MWYWIIGAIIGIVIFDIIVLIWWKSTTIHTKTLEILNFVELRRNTNLNLFGVVFIGLLLNVMMLPLAIFYWLHLACTWHPKKRDNSNG